MFFVGSRFVLLGRHSIAETYCAVRMMNLIRSNRMCTSFSGLPSPWLAHLCADLMNGNVTLWVRFGLILNVGYETGHIWCGNIITIAVFSCYGTGGVGISNAFFTLATYVALARPLHPFDFGSVCILHHLTLAMSAVDFGSITARWECPHLTLELPSAILTSAALCATLHWQQRRSTALEHLTPHEVSS